MTLFLMTGLSSISQLIAEERVSFSFFITLNPSMTGKVDVVVGWRAVDIIFSHD